jgi:hypothetical protein
MARDERRAVADLVLGQITFTGFAMRLGGSLPLVDGGDGGDPFSRLSLTCARVWCNGKNRHYRHRRHQPHGVGLGSGGRYMQRSKKDRRIPAPEELPRLFDDKFVRELKPPRADIPRRST